jgi:hypothetical protein
VHAERCINKGATEKNRIVPTKLFLSEAYSMQGSEIWTKHTRRLADNLYIAILRLYQKSVSSPLKTESTTGDSKLNHKWMYVKELPIDAWSSSRENRGIKVEWRESTQGIGWNWLKERGKITENLILPGGVIESLGITNASRSFWVKFKSFLYTRIS